MAGKSPFSMDYVYTTEDMEFRNLHVELTVSGSKTVVAITPEHTMTLEELDGVLYDIESDVLKKVRICIMDECQVVVHQDGKDYDVVLTDDKPRVKGLIYNG